MVGGAADLVESTKTVFEGAGTFSRDFAGRNVPFGVREHAMGAIVNGLCLHGGMRQALRLDLPDLLGLHAPRGAALGAHEPAGRLGLDARLGRSRRGRPDAPAGRALRGAPRDPEPLAHPAGRRERDVVRLEGRARARGGAGRAPAHAAGRARARPRARSPTQAASSAAPTSLWEANGNGVPDLLLLATGSEVSVALEAGRAAR